MFFRYAEEYLQKLMKKIKEFMIHIIWKFEVDPMKTSAFEEIYNSQGKWSLLFSKSKDFHGTTLLKDQQNANTYFTIDKWSTLEEFENFKNRNYGDYNDLDKECEQLTLTETMVGIFKNI